MKVTLKLGEMDLENIKRGDYIVLDGGAIRQIIEGADCCYYYALDPTDGALGWKDTNIQDLVQRYIDSNDSVRVIKNSQVELIMRG